MGILDEAIREHLALKRRQGLSDDEIRRLEDEAFGPPARPGEPDFPAPAAEEEADLPPADASEPAAQEEFTAAEPETDRTDEAEAPTALFDHGEAAEVPDAEESEAADRAASDEGSAGIEGAPPSAAEEEMPAGELAISDLDLDLGDETPPASGDAEAEAPRSTPDAPAPQVEDEPAPPESREPPISSLETVEHRIDEPESGPAADAEPAPAEEPESEEYALETDGDEYDYTPESDEYTLEPDSDVHALDEPDEPGEASADRPPEQEPQADPAEEREDVLGGTPDFLRDAPEDDELWFEQGEPKDFDF